MQDEFRDFTDSKFIQLCDIPVQKKVEPFTLIIFGGAGDLCRRKLLPTLFHLCAEKELPKDFAIYGVGTSRVFNLDGDIDKQYKELTQQAINNAFSEDVYCSDENKDKFINNVNFIYGKFDEDVTYEKLKKNISDSIKKMSASNIIYYMAVPPFFFLPIIEKIDKHGLNKIGKTRIIIEKPFGNNLKTAIELNNEVKKVFKEEQVYRIDHYLGKETVQNIIFFRFSNSIFEPLWNRRYIDNVQITVAEDIGIEHRGNFYDKTGILRDIIQNHMMQLIALVAMEPPVGFEPDLIRDEKVKVMRSIRIPAENNMENMMVRGQYDVGKINNEDVNKYRAEENIADDSITPTFFAGKFYIDSWRWANVPFYVRAGKRLKKRLSEICIQFKQPPLRLFGRNCDPIEPSFLILRIQPKEQIFLRFGVKYPNKPNNIHPVNMKFDYEEYFNKKRYPAYSRLLLDCLREDLTLFVRQDGVEAMWEIIDPIIENWNKTNPEFPNYSAGSWGPKAADDLLKRDNRYWMTNMFDA